MTPRTPSTEAGRRLLHMTGGWAGELVEVVLAIEAEARAPLEAERDLWKRDWGIKNDQWEKAIEARAPLEAEIERLRAVLDAAADWETYYGDIDTDGEESWMTQLDHGHEEYEVRITVMAALRAALREDPTP